MTDDMQPDTAEVVDGKPETDEPYGPQSWVQRHRNDDDALVELVDWVDMMLTEHQPLVTSTEEVVPCWPAHPGAVSQFAALRSAWRSAVYTDDTEDEYTTSVASFYQYYWYPGLARIKSQLKSCSVSRHEPDSPPVLTDRRYMASMAHRTND